jgi:hypothetical protein
MDLVSHDMDGGGRAELDSHADTCVGGSNVALLHATGFTVSVSAYSPEYDALPDIPIATCAGAYDSDVDGSTYLLIWNEMMYFGDRMPVTLVNANQLRNNGHTVDDCPQQFDA